jgi:hypothetical protein
MGLDLQLLSKYKEEEDFVLQKTKALKEHENAYKQTSYHLAGNWVRNTEPLKYNDFLLSISINQLRSKTWLVEKLGKIDIPPNKNGKFDIEVIGGWFGFPLLELLDELFAGRIESIDYYDIDPFCKKVLWRYVDVNNFPVKINYFENFFDRKEYRTRQLVINTSQEHMPYITGEYFKHDPVVVMQSNNFWHDKDHTNACFSEEEFVTRCGLQNLQFRGTLMQSSFDRYMAIGQFGETNAEKNNG